MIMRYPLSTVYGLATKDLLRFEYIEIVRSIFGQNMRPYDVRRPFRSQVAVIFF